MDGHEITELNLSSLERTMRIDAEFYKKEHIAVDKVLSSWNKKSIADCFYVSDGNHMSISDSFCEVGVPYYRGQDIYNLFIENASPLMIDRTTFDRSQMRRSHLQKGDICTRACRIAYPFELHIFPQGGHGLLTRDWKTMGVVSATHKHDRI